jgi:hypothetical protein
MMNARKVKIFESHGFTELERQLNEWLTNTCNRVESISYAASSNFHSALVYYRYLPPLEEQMS